MSASAHTVIPCVPFFSFTLAEIILFNLLLLFKKGYEERQKQKSKNEKVRSKSHPKVIQLSNKTYLVKVRRVFWICGYHKAKSQKVFSIYRTLLAQKGGKAKIKKIDTYQIVLWSVEIDESEGSIRTVTR